MKASLLGIALFVAAILGCAGESDRFKTVPISDSTVMPTVEIGCEIEFSLERAQEVIVTVFDTGGHAVVVVHDGVLEAGHHKLRWNGKAADGTEAKHAPYFAEIKAEDFTLTKVLLYPPSRVANPPVVVE